MRKISLRLFISILLLPFLILILLCSIILYHSGTAQYTQLLRENSEALVLQTKDSVNQDMAELYELCSDLASSSHLFSLDYNLRQNAEPAISPANYVQLSENLTRFLRNHPTHLQYIGLHLEDKSISYFVSSTSSTLIPSPDFHVSENIPEFSAGLHWLGGHRYPIYGDYTASYNLFLPLGDSYSSNHGFFVIGLRDAMFTDSLKNCRLTQHSRLFLLSGNDFLSWDDGDAWSMLDQREILDTIQNLGTQNAISRQLKDWYLVYSPLLLADSGVLALIPTQEMMVNYHGFTTLFLMVILISLGAFLLLYVLIPPFFTRPIVDLTRQLSGISTMEDVRRSVKIYGSKEIDQISEGIRALLERIEALNESMRQEMKARQYTQLQYLFAQVNPHFLYNALDCIGELCAGSESTKAQEMVSQLATFYRIGVSKGRDYISLKDELLHVSMYLSILRTRFEDFQYQIECPDELLSCLCLRTILQPIAENAVYHGLRPFRRDGTVTIRAWKESQFLHLCVADDGGGISDEVLEQLLDSLNAPIGQYSQNSLNVYGLKNVQDRIQLAYGNDYRIQVSTREDFGTEITLTIPFEEEHYDGHSSGR